MHMSGSSWPLLCVSTFFLSPRAGRGLPAPTAYTLLCTPAAHQLGSLLCTPTAVISRSFPPLLASSSFHLLCPAICLPSARPHLALSPPATSSLPPDPHQPAYVSHWPLLYHNKMLVHQICIVGSVLVQFSFWTPDSMCVFYWKPGWVWVGYKCSVFFFFCITVSGWTSKCS